MPQNIYDNVAFFDLYSQLDRSVQGLSGAPEWPALQSYLPPMEHLRVLDLGCGFGWFSRWAADAGAASVLGVDLSERMLSRARSEESDGSIEYLKADLDSIELAPDRFDLVFSSLALHYVKDLASLFNKIHRSLRGNGRLVFSVEHPILLAPSDPGWKKLESGSTIWPLDGYLDEGPRTVNWLVNGVVKEHRTVASYLNLLIGSGYLLRALEEWGPSQAQIMEHPEWSLERNRPYFLLVSAQRGQDSVA
ncbi:SAM-dependent methyltransferase [Frateuria sp. Soil773]|uniref:class I SAM-dependent methyltransferase n=1 Tax=Frateuria sp. Soil773 TaxID=1736407 RepID=UPI0006F3506B|nr:class I SAM-dependent methyltransferase [Frateuria sp. Soil773]KRE89383.1 SAM-dependent methyltransferase [Frateuria sp. Soil773]